MSFYYDDNLTVSRDKVRFYIGDTQESAGPRPDRRNLSDDEIAFVLTEEDSRVNGAVAHLFETLSNEWTAYAIQEREGETSFDAKEVAKQFALRAVEWRTKPGGASEAENSANLITLTREDAWT